VTAAALSHAGSVRPQNEDHYVIARVGRSLQCQATSLPPGEIPSLAAVSGRLLIVADGMGGHAAGELASRTAVRTLIDLILDRPDWILRLDDTTLEKVTARAKGYYARVHEVLGAASRADAMQSGMGTTLTAAYVVGSRVLVAHVGDSRAYLHRDDKLHLLTRDHTHVQALVAAGLLTREEAATHSLRHILSNALGGRAPSVEVDVHEMALQNGDRLLLCTDGLTEVVGDREIAAVLARPVPPDAACRALLDLALAAGAPDNVTLIAADIAF
jgi:protein phosphatase